MKNNGQHTVEQGTSQFGRFLAALDPDNVKLHELKVADWMEFAWEFAELVHYFSGEDSETSDGNWKGFFNLEQDFETLLEEGEQADIPPHLALFITFLKLLDYPQQELNGLARKHLDFYYQEVLRLKKRPITPDRIHVLIELAQRAKHELIDQAVLLDAGKDDMGRPLRYKMVRPLVANQARVVDLKSVFVDEGKLKIALTANSKDGNSDVFENQEPWSAFGEDTWVDAEQGFCIASPLLQMQEGIRTISLTFSELNSNGLPEISEAFVTGEEGWIPLIIPEEQKKGAYTFLVESGEESLVNFDKEVHEMAIDTPFPVLKVLFASSLSYRKLREFRFGSIKLKVQVEEITQLDLRGPLGNLDPTQPFMPFGPRPKIGSKLRIAYPEMNYKPIKSYNLSMVWLDLPLNFDEHYEEYQEEIEAERNRIEQQKGFGFNFNAILLNAEFQWIGPTFVGFTGVGVPKKDELKDSYKVKVQSSIHADSKTYPLFANFPQIEYDVQNPSPVKTVEMELILTNSFYHDLYPKLYAKAILNGGENLPDEPYTPLLDILALGYTAEENIDLTGQGQSRLFHLHPFGTKRVTHPERTFVPSFYGSELYIGLENAEPKSNLSLLFQVEEGSENPSRSGGWKTDDIKWEILAQDHWQDLKPDMLRDSTNHFLRSGLVEFALPKTATKKHTVLPEGLHWLRIRLKKEPDTVCKFIGVHAQAGEAVFENNANSLTHLDTGLPPDSIIGLGYPKSKVAAVSQPYPSFGGRPEENDREFYQRVSERLRHKDRAVSAWDYEHLVLENFPGLYKVKCLRHTQFDYDKDKLNNKAPGYTTLVLIPKVSELKTQALRLEPKVSEDFKTGVYAWIKKKTTVFAEVDVVNPNYQEVDFQFSIRFKEGLDFHYYKEQTELDLTKMLAPWVYDPDRELRFGDSFTKYEVIHYLENRAYVDYVTDFALIINGKPVNRAVPLDERTILIPGSFAIKEEEKCKL